MAFPLSKRLLVDSVLLVVMVALLISPVQKLWAQFHEDNECFCKVGESVDDCACASLNSVDGFNNDRVHSALKKLLHKDFFKFYRVNMEKPCPFWPDDRKCGSKECSIGYCDEEVPHGLKTSLRSAGPFRPLAPTPTVGSTPCILKAGSSALIGVGVAVAAEKERARDDGTKNSTLLSQIETSDYDDIAEGIKKNSVAKSSKVESGLPAACERSNQFDPIDTSLTEGDRAQLQEIETFDDMAQNFCDVDDEFSSEMHYVNLQKNPERYTGYKGDSALKVWQSIYQENCFKPDPKFDKNFLLYPDNRGLCLEKRVFYRLISGLHSAITVSIASNSYKPAENAFSEGKWYKNVDMFEGRFGTKWSKEGPERLKNLYFVYLLELRALVKAAPYLEKELFFTGNEQEDQETRQLVEGLLELLKTYPDQFDETQLFTGIDSHARSLREEFRQKFVNISRIMDCVGCDKCRLWGKVYTHGMGTALKILFSDISYSPTSMVPAPFKLTRNEVVALFQSFGRYSSSIWEISEFRDAIRRRRAGLGE